MAKLQGPLFSISASGHVGAVLCYSTTNATTRAIRSPVPSGRASTPQRLERDRLALAASCWRNLDTAAREEWQAYAATKFQNPWIAFSREYIIQQCLSPDLPLLPAQTWPAP